MKPEQNSAVYRPSWIRTGSPVLRAGVYLIRCTVCYAVDRKSLPHGAPGPPCLRCCRPAQCRFLHDEPAKEVPPETAPRPIEASLEPPIAPPAPAVEAKASGPSALSAWGWHDVPKEVDSPIVEVNSKASAEAPTDPKKNATAEESSSTELKPTLFERLGGRKPVDQKAGAKSRPAR
jgi:hypothetical protein